MLRNTVVIFVLLFSAKTFAQQTMWGTGAYGGMQACPYNVRAGNGAVSEDDETKEIQSEIAEAQAQLKEKKAEKKKISRETERAKKDITRSLSEGHAEFIFEHVENSRRCQEYKGFQVKAAESVVQVQEGPKSIANENLVEVRAPFSLSEWEQYCDPNKPGAVSAAVCTNPSYKKGDGGRNDAESCKKGLAEYRKSFFQGQKLDKEIEQLQESLQRSKENLKQAKKDAQEAQRERRQAGTEGDTCIECQARGNGYAYQKPQTDWGSSLGNIALGVGSIAMGYQTNKMIAGYNAQNGWETNPYSAVGYGYGLGALGTGISQMTSGGSGIYGAMSGGIGQGAFGCAGNNGGSMGMMGAYGGANGNGMWGNPYAMSAMGNMNMGGGIYNSGMGPWGMNGMGGMNGMNGMGGLNMMGGMNLGMNSMNPYSSMMNPYSMMGLGNNMSSMGSYDPSMMQSQMQYQQQMMQLQMQQYQNYYQQQQQKYSAMSSLQQEMAALMARIQQVQYGGSSYLGTSTLYGTNNGITPLPGSNLLNTTSIIPASR